MIVRTRHFLRPLTLLFVLGVLAIQSPSLRAHGGTYRGPGSGLGPGTSGPAGPSGPATPGGPMGPRTGGGAGAATGGAPDAAGDLTAWQLWWSLNRDGYLELKAALARDDRASSGDAFFGGTPPATAGAARPAEEVVRARVVPALIDLIATEKSPEISTAVLLALGKIGAARCDPALVGPVIRAAIPSSNQEVSETAVLTLGLFGDVSTCASLVDLLDDAPGGRKSCGRDEVPARTRAFAAYALGVLGRETKNRDVQRFVVHHLARVLDADTSSSRDVQVACMVAIGLVPLDLASHAEPQDNAAAPDEFAHIQAWLADKNRSELVRAYAPVTLAHMSPHAGSGARAALIESCLAVLAASTNAGVGASLRQSAVTALGLVADGDDQEIDVRARTALQKQIGEGDRLARRLALIALARASSRPGAGNARALDATRAFLAAEFERASTPERPWIALALGLLERDAAQSGAKSSPEVTALIANALVDHAGPTEAGAYCLALGLHAGPEAAHVLLTALGDARDDQVRGHAAIALGLSGAPAAIEPLRHMVLDSRYRPTLLREAAIGLALLGDKTVSLELVAMLKDAQGLTAQSAIATAVGFVGDGRTVDPLIAILRDAKATVGSRAFSAVALGMVCDRRPLPWNACLAADSNYWVPPSTLFDPSSGTGVLDIL
jgi:hypothetical protein